MEETKIWSIDGNGISATRLATVNQMETEPLLENLLTANPDMLEEGLELVGRQTSTSGGPLDLLGVDTDGRLVVYELKRGRLNRDAVAQVIDYASYLNTLEADSLASHIENQSGKHGIEKIHEFKDWYSKFRASNELPEEDLETLKPPRMVLVGLGVDDTTERMVQYMASGGMDISLLTFHGFMNSDGRTLLARNVEVDSDRVSVNQGPRSRHRNRRARFEEHLQGLPTDTRDVFDAAERMIRAQHRRLSATYANTWVNFNLDYSWYQASELNRVATLFIELDELEKCVKFGFHPIAVHLVSMNEFEDTSIAFEI
ncbi:MAG: DUF91 domain-containing protein [Chloroflexi bacterium]|nr:DUF91 domain-containing protein [Chloroflexota bacterium]